MAIDVTETPVVRTFYTAIKLMMTALGYPDPGTVLNPNRDTTRAIEAFQVAYNELWYAHRWDWRFAWHTITLVENQVWYDAPPRFSEADAHLGQLAKVAGLKFLTWDLMCKKYPWIRHVPADYASAINVAEMAAWDDFAAPQYWTYKTGNIGIWPVPSQDILDAMDSPFLVGGFYANIVQPTEDLDELECGVDLYGTLHTMALGLFKEAMEWPDAALTMGRGERMLAQAKARARRIYINDSQLMPEA